MKSIGLNEHSRRATAGVIDPSAIRLQHLNQQPNYAAWSVELTASSPLRDGKLLQEILIHPSQHVTGP